MRKRTVFLAVFFYMAGMAAYAQSLGDIAKEEQKRREAVTGSVTTVIQSAPPAAQDEKSSTEDAAAKKDGKKSEPDELTDLYGKPESYWRNVMSEARSRLKQLEDETKELASWRNALQLRHDSTNGSWRAPIKNEIDRTRQAQEQNKKNLEDARSKLQSLRDEARSSGALPGWVE